VKVLIAHVRYEHRGGEDIHVDSLVEAYGKLGIEVSFLPDSGSQGKGAISRALQSLSPTKNFSDFDAYLKQSRPDFIHINNAFPDLGPRFFRWIRARKIPSLMTIHNHRFYCTNGLAMRDGVSCKLCLSAPNPARPVLLNCNSDLRKSTYHALALAEMRTERLYQDSVTRYIAPSPYIKAELVRSGIEEFRISQIIHPISGSGLDLSLTHVDEYRWDVLYAGRLSKEKGTENLLKCIEQMPDLKFVVAGGGPERGAFEKAQEKCRNLTYLGPVSSEQVRELLRLSRCSIAPSVCQEALGLFILESFVSARRCVVADLESTRWLGAEPFPGIVAKTDQVSHLVRAIRDAIEKGPVSVEASYRLRNQLGLERFCNQLQDEILRLLNKTSLK
jgi:glycosyltransferase involved in cell wall biosynthesis